MYVNPSGQEFAKSSCDFFFAWRDLPVITTGMKEKSKKTATNKTLKLSVLEKGRRKTNLRRDANSAVPAIDLVITGTVTVLYALPSGDYL